MYAKPNLKYFSAVLSIVVAAALAVAPQARQAPAASSDQTTLRRQSKDSSKKAAAAGNTGSEDQQDQDEAANDESDDPAPAPAALQIDVSAEPPLIKELYQATRETKEQAILASLARAKGILTNGADLRAVDRQGRTALHWVIFGCSYSTNPNVQVAYEELADKMIAGGIDINKEDAYQDTALDYLLYSANFEIQTLLLEHGANSGFLAASVQYVKEEAAEEVAEERLASARTPVSRDALWRGADLTPGQTLSVRLDTPVFSDRSRTGDPVTATVTYPLCKGGENIRCKDGELVLPPGTKIDGTILFAQKAPDKYTRPRVVLDFSNVLHKSGAKSALYTRVLNVDNARETVRNNEILGIIQPHASKKMSLIFTGLGATNPIAGYTVKSIQTAYGLSVRREVHFPAGTDVQIQIVRPSKLKQRESWPGWPLIEADANLQQLVNSAPMRTNTPAKVPSDPTNLMFLGSQKQLQAAFGEAGWFEADGLNVKTALKTVQATLRNTGYADAPMSTLLLEGQLPDLTFQKSLNTFAKRHHLRVWKLPSTYRGQDVWVAAATHDIATSSSRAKTKWSHRIDPHIDRERDWVETDLLFIGTATGYVDIDRPSALRNLSNATGDDIVTDGKMTVVQLGPPRVSVTDTESAAAAGQKPERGKSKKN
jgi:LssY C-terminus